MLSCMLQCIEAVMFLLGITLRFHKSSRVLQAIGKSQTKLYQDSKSWTTLQ